MKAPGFLKHALVALALSIVGSAALTSLVPMVGVDDAWRWIIALLAFFYMAYLLGHSRARIGRISAFAVWALGASLLSVFDPTWTLYLGAHIGLIWLVRSLYYYRSVLSAVLDFGLILLGLVLASAAAAHAQSVFLTLWCFFLCQALFVFVPPTMRKTRPSQTDFEQRFRRAHRAAEIALRRLSAQPRSGG